MEAGQCKKKERSRFGCFLVLQHLWSHKERLDLFLFYFEIHHGFVPPPPQKKAASSNAGSWNKCSLLSTPQMTGQHRFPSEKCSRQTKKKTTKKSAAGASEEREE